MSLSRFVLIKSNYNNKYLRYIHEDVQKHGFLQFSGEKVVSPYAKFEVERANNGDGLVHIRCCYNNKYWVTETHDRWWIVAGADEPEEDQSKWSCTLFKPINVDAEARTVRFLHVQLGHYVCLCRNDATFDSCLFAGSKKPDNDSCDVCAITDWESLLRMPQHVAFKGDNSKYLNACKIDGHNFLQFASDDVHDSIVGNEISTTNDGSIRVKSNHFGKFWRCNPNWIWADSNDTTNDNSDTLFWPIKVDNNVVALCNIGNNNFCKRLTAEGMINCLSARDPTNSKEVRLVVEELVVSRKIRNVNFSLLDARTYRQRVLTMASKVATNMSQEPNNAEVKLSYTETKSSTWNASVSLKLGVKTSFQTGVPSIGEGKIEISSQFNGACQWGETKISSPVLEKVYKVTVPPMTMVTVSLLANVGSCDVPFSYTQCDTLTNGQEVTFNMNDGIYTGINFFNFKFETKQEKL